MMNNTMTIERADDGCGYVVGGQAMCESEVINAIELAGFSGPGIGDALRTIVLEEGKTMELGVWAARRGWWYG